MPSARAAWCARSLVPVAAAHDLHAKIASSTLEIIDGMGHDLPEALWPRVATAILRDEPPAA